MNPEVGCTLVIDIEDMVDFYFKAKFNSSIAWSSETLDSNHKYAILYLHDCDILSDPEDVIPGTFICDPEYDH